MWEKYTEPQPWFRSYVHHEKIATHFDMVGLPAPADYPLDRFWLADKSTGNWIPIRETIEMGAYETALALGEEPTFETIPLLSIGEMFFDAYDGLLEELLRQTGLSQALTAHGIKVVADNWRNLILPRPATVPDFETWVRGRADSGERWVGGKYATQLWGHKAEKAKYTTANLSEVLEAFHYLFRKAQPYWTKLAEDKYARIAQEYPHYRRLREAGLGFRAWDLQYSQHMTYILGTWREHEDMGESIGIVATDTSTGLPIGLLLGRITAMSERAKIASNMSTHRTRWIGNSEVVLHDPEVREFSVVPMLHLTLCKQLWEDVDAIGLTANFDGEIDTYKGTFRPISVNTPGLRWIEPRFAKQRLMGGV